MAHVAPLPHHLVDGGDIGGRIGDGIGGHGKRGSVKRAPV
jgi:hypothetical protein